MLIISGWTDEQKQQRREEMAIKKARNNFFNKVSVKLIDSNSKQPNQPGPSCENSDYEARARSSRKRVKRFSFSNPSSTSKKALKTNSAKKDPTDSDSDWSDDNNKSELTNNLWKSKVQMAMVIDFIWIHR